MKKLLGLVVVAALALSSSAVRADYQTSYTANLKLGQGDDITNIMLLERGDGFGSATWAFSIPRDGTSTITNPFASPDPIHQALLLGIVTGLPFDGTPEQKHIVMFMDPTAAQLATHIAWGTLFRNTLEEDLIAAIELATSGQDWPIIQPGLDFVGEFANGDAENGILGPGGVPHTAWLNNPGPLTVMTFSDGEVVGFGDAQITFVPEPATLAIMGLGGLLFARVRRRA